MSFHSETFRFRVNQSFILLINDEYSVKAASTNFKIFGFIRPVYHARFEPANPLYTMGGGYIKIQCNVKDVDLKFVKLKIINGGSL